MQSTTIPTGRGRSLEGCLTCRQRHVKCDQRKPSCRRCDKSRLLCGGYENSIVFGAEKSLEADTTRARRPLLTESERRRMSRLMTASIPPVLVWHQLNELDDDCETVAPDQDIAVSRGPFGVFRIHDSSRDTVPLHQNPIQIVDGEPASGFDFGADLATEDLQLSPATMAWFNSAFDQSNSESDGLFIRPGFLSSDMSRVVEVRDEVMPDYSDFMVPRREHSFSQFPVAFPTDINSFATVPSISHSLSANNTVPENAVFLLSHYSTTVISLLTPFRHNKTPWHILFIPHVKNCLAAIAMGESLDDASLCIFYATLALSAFSMSGISRSQSWMDEGKAHKSRAQYHAQIMLKAAYQVPKVAKYKSILMALITMVQVWLFSADQMRTEYFFLEAEKFIRLKGLSRLKSRKVRLLHHCYVFERLFYESTSVSAKVSTQRARLQQDVQSSDVVAHGQDSPSFRVPIFVNLDKEMGRQKDQQEGENDLHLEKIGDFPATLYPEIFGVPETYMLLLSLIIRLGKARDGAEAGHVEGEPSISGYMAQAKAVERAILQMRQTDGTATNHSPFKQGENKVVMDNMLTAIQEALLIYLYRRIYDVDSTLLQSRVVAIRDCLLRCEAADEGSVCGSAGFIWPAFIAACEAEDVGVQGSFADLFNKVAQKSGLVKFSDMLLDVQEIWRERRKQSCSSFTWLDLMRRKIEKG